MRKTGRLSEWLSTCLGKTSDTSTSVKIDDNDIELVKLTETLHQIEELFADQSFPSLVILDGAWGSGKTFFAREFLIPKYERNNNILYLTVLGVASINDFTNRLLGTFIKSTAGQKYTLIDGVESVFGKLENNANRLGLVGSIGAGFSDILKGAMLNKLADFKIIVDDLERVAEPALRSQIIGECYQLAETKGISFLFLTDRQKLDLEEKHFEKYFSGAVPFLISSDEIFDIVFKVQPKSSYSEKIRELLTHYNVKNIRVLKRLNRRISNIEKEVQKIDYADVKATMHLVVEEAFAITWLSYVHEKDSNKIASLLNFSTLLMRDDEPQEDIDLKKKVSGLIYPSNDLIRYIIGKSHYIEDVASLVRIIRKQCPIDAFLFSVFNDLDEKNFDDGVKGLENYIFNQKSVRMQKWFECCEVYKLLIEWEYIDGNVDNFLSEVEDHVELKDFSYETDRNRTYRVSDERLLALIEKTKIELKKNSQQIWVEEFVGKLGDWLEAEKHIRNDVLESKLHLICLQNWKEAIKKWSPLSCVEFGGFLRERYKGQLLRSHFAQEEKLMHDIKDFVEELITEQDYGQKRGALVRLHLAIKSLIAVAKNDIE